MTDPVSGIRPSTRRYTGELMNLRHGLEASVGQAQFNPEGTLRVMRGEQVPAGADEAEPQSVMTEASAVEPMALAGAGRTLEDIIAGIATGSAGAAMPMMERVALAARLCQAVATVHANGVACNDIKPALVTVGIFGEIGLIERGAATPFGAVARVGTPAYMSPEQARGEPASVAGDIYALGVVCHRLFSLRFPLWDTSPDRFWERKRRGERDPAPASGSDLPAALMAICGRALSPQPVDRYPHAAAMAADLHAFLDGSPVAALPEGLLRRVVRHGRRWRWPLTVAACILAAAAVIIGVDRSHAERYGVLVERMEQEEHAQANRLAMAVDRWEALSKRLAESEARIGWKQVIDLDFSKPIDPRLEAVQVNERLRIERGATDLLRRVDGTLELLPAPFRTFLRWQGGVGEDARIDVEVERDPASGWNLDLAVAGDSLTGYRLRVDGLGYIGLETVERGWADLLARVPDPQLTGRERMSLSLRHTAGHVTVLLDGAEIIRYLDHRQLAGAEHRRVSVGRFFEKGVLRIRRMTVWTRSPGEFVGVLDPGVVWSRAGRSDEARAWFEHVAADPPTPQAGFEASLRAALCIPRGAARQDALIDLARRAGYPLAGNACLAAIDEALNQDRWDDLPALIGHMRTLAKDDLMRRVVLLLIGRMPAGTADQAAWLKAYAATGASDFRVPRSGLTDLTALHGSSFVSIWVTGNAITDLAPIAQPALRSLQADGNLIGRLPSFTGAKLELIDLARNPLKDLQELAGQDALRHLNLSGTGISDLQPLAGCSSLERMEAAETAVEDLSPLAGKPLKLLALADSRARDLASLAGTVTLEHLVLHRTRIEDLAPLASCTGLIKLGLAGTAIADLRPLASLRRLTDLDIADTQVSDISALSGLPLKRLDLKGTRVTEVRSLARMGLQRLSLARTQVVDLSPLAGVPLTHLDLSGHPREDLSPLLSMPLESLALPSGPYTEAQERILLRMTIPEIRLDPSDAWQWKVAGQMRGVRRINGMPVAEALAAQPATLELFTGGRPRCDGLGRRVGRSRLVILPVLVTPARALELAARAGARLPVLADQGILSGVLQEMYQSLPRSGASIHVGIGWHDGRPGWVDGRSVDDRLLAPAEASFLQRGWAVHYESSAQFSIHPPDHTAYLALEFPE